MDALTITVLAAHQPLAKLRGKFGQVSCVGCVSLYSPNHGYWEVATKPGGKCCACFKPLKLATAEYRG